MSLLDPTCCLYVKLTVVDLFPPANGSNKYPGKCFHYFSKRTSL